MSYLLWRVSERRRLADHLLYDEAGRYKHHQGGSDQHAHRIGDLEMKRIFEWNKYFLFILYIYVPECSPWRKSRLPLTPWALRLERIRWRWPPSRLAKWCSPPAGEKKTRLIFGALRNCAYTSNRSKGAYSIRRVNTQAGKAKLIGQRRGLPFMTIACAWPQFFSLSLTIRNKKKLSSFSHGLPAIMKGASNGRVSVESCFPQKIGAKAAKKIKK